MKRLSILVLLFFFPILVMAQGQMHPITLEYCQNRIEETYPAARKIDIQNKITDLNIRLAKTGFYPEIMVSAGTSYQSDVTEVPFSAPGNPAPTFSKDHYNISIDITQPVFDAGRTRISKKLEKSLGASELSSVETEMWGVQTQLNQVYFGTLLLQKQQETAELLLKDLNEQLKMVSSKVKNGVMLPSNELVLKAEIIKAKQQIIQVQADKEAAYAVLGLLIDEPISPDQNLELPDMRNWEAYYQNPVERPEYKVFDANEDILKVQSEMAHADKLPVISAFAKTAYARPGLNSFDDDLQLYWLVGLKAQWSFRNWRNSDRKAEVLEWEQRTISAGKDAFTIQLEAGLSQKLKQIEALKQQIMMDEEVKELRKQIVEEKKSQLKEGTITSTDYVTELNAENRTLLMLEIHTAQKVQVMIEYVTQKGILWN